jgi:VanZ family protein
MIKKNLFSILVALLILYLSLTSSDAFKKVAIYELPNLDKIVHAGLYFLLMSAIIFDNRKTINKSSHLFLTALIPLAYGIFMEILQSSLTISRSASIYDVIANTTGILLSVLLWLLLKPMLKDKFR